MAVIAINQALGSRGAELGRMVAELLGYRFLTSADLAVATASRFNVTAEHLKLIDERHPNFWERLGTDIDRFEAFFRAVTLREMAADRVVAVGRGIALMMPEGACGLRVRTTGPIAERTRQVAADEKLERSAAERRVRDADREIRARLQHLYAMDVEDPALYAMVVNTFSIPMETIAGMIAGCAARMDEERGKELDRLRDASLAAQVRAALLAHPKVGSAQIRVQCTGGRVQVSGTGLVPPWDELVARVAREVEGVASIEVASEEPPIPPRSA
jgi:cytidylate kinase